MNFFKLYIGDYQRDTGTLSLSEHGAYMLMLQHFYATEQPLPTGRDLHRLLRCETKIEREAVDSVVSRFWKATDAGLINERAIQEFGRAAEISETNRSIALAREAKKRANREHEACSKRAHNENAESSEKHQKNLRNLQENDAFNGYEKPDSTTTENNNNSTKHFENKGITHQEQSTKRAQSVLDSCHERSTNQTPDTRYQTKSNQVETHTQDHPTAGVCVFPVSDCCKALIEAGIPATKINQGHPKLLALIEAGATAVEFGDTARECVNKGNPAFAYVLGTMTRRREQAAATQLHKGAMPRKPTPGQRSADAAQRWLESQPQEAIEHDAQG